MFLTCLKQWLTGLFMPLDTIGNDRLVHCPHCGDPMRLMPAGAYDDLPKTQTFACESCGAEAVTENALDMIELAAL